MANVSIAEKRIPQDGRIGLDVGNKSIDLRVSVFPNMVTSMVDVGEENGELDKMLNRRADNYDEDVDNAVAGITSIIEPIMIVFLALAVGFIVIALFLPIVEIIKQLTG